MNLRTGGRSAGTTNVDNRSSHITSGCSGLVVNRQFTAYVVAMFVSGFVGSVLLEQSVFDGKPCWHGLAAKTANLAAPMF